MKWLAILYSFTFAFMPIDDYGLIDNNNQICREFKNANYVDFSLGVELFDCLSFYGGEKSKQVPYGILNFKPYYQEYYLGLEYNKKFSDALNLQAGIIRECNHGLTVWGKNDFNVDNGRFEIYVNVHGKFNVF